MNIADLTRQPATDPLDLYRYRDGLYAVDLLGAAVVEFDFFTWLDTHPSNAVTIARQFGFAARPNDVMLTLFASLGLIEARAGAFHLTPLAREFVVRTSPWFMGPYFASLKSRPVCQDFAKVLRTGRAANWGSFKEEKDWTRAMEDPAFAREFTAAMDCRGAYLAPALARALPLGDRRTLLDIAGGSGIYACALAAYHPQLRATVLEKPPVDAVAARAIRERACEARVQVTAGDMLKEELPGGFDVHLYSNVLHDWDEPVVRGLLEKSARALAPGGILAIHDMHLNDDKTGPRHVAEYSALLMHSTEGRCYSVAELRAWCAAIGLGDVQHAPTAAGRSVVTVRRLA